MQVSFEIPIAQIYVATSIFISPTLISFTISQNGELNLGHVIQEFLPSSDLTETTAAGKNRLKNWPSFIPDPLSIALVYFHLEASKTDSWALTKMNMKLKIADEISWFDDKIRINNLELDLNYEKERISSTYGVILGRVALGPADNPSPRVDVRIPFPFNNEEISFTFTDFSVENVVEALVGPEDFKSFFPRDFPELFKHIQLDKIAVAFDDKGSFDMISVDAGIPGMWQIFGQFSMGNVKVHFQYGKKKTTKTPPNTETTTAASPSTSPANPDTGGPGPGPTGPDTGNPKPSSTDPDTDSAHTKTDPAQPNSDQPTTDSPNPDTGVAGPDTGTAAGEGATESTTQKTWRLVVKGQIVIATCTITIEANFESKLVSMYAEGARCSISIGDILEKIHLNGLTLPSMISGFTIFNPRLRVAWERPDDVTQVGSKSIAFAASTSLFHQSEV